MPSLPVDFLSLNDKAKWRISGFFKAPSYEEILLNVTGLNVALLNSRDSRFEHTII